MTGTVLAAVAAAGPLAPASPWLWGVLGLLVGAGAAAVVISRLFRP
ncbi:hypothetical protein [Nocardiopsis coralliicola]